MDAMQCEVAREALSARIDGEREPVPAARVDEHLDGCAQCCSWYVRAQNHSRRLRLREAESAMPDLTDDLLGALSDPALSDPALSDRTLVTASLARQNTSPQRLAVGWISSHRASAVLLVAGVATLVVALTQLAGVTFGMVDGHPGAMASPAMDGEHLMHESVAAQLSLAAAMVVAALWRQVLPGVAVIAGTFAVFLIGFVIADAVAGVLTAARVASHLPVVIGAVAALLAWRTERDTAPDQRAATPPRVEVPAHARLGKRRTHLRPTDDSAA